jgi:hypothetical protein
MGDTEMRTGTVIEMAVQQLSCTGCGAEANASCNCGKPYVPKKQRIADAIAANPQKSNRSIGEEVGASHTLVNEVRKEGGNHFPPEREGRDGKTYHIQPREESDDDETDETEEGLRVIAARGFLNRAKEAKEIATLGKLQASDITEAMVSAADEAAAAWGLAAQNLRRMIQ